MQHLWAHARRKLCEIHDSHRSEIAAQGLRRIAAMYAIEKPIRGEPAEVRLAVRQARTAPRVKEFGAWLKRQRARVSAKSRLGEKLDEIMRQREPELKAAVEASLGGDIKKAFEKLGSNVAEVEPDNLAGAAAARWLRLSPEKRENTGLIAPSHALRHKINAIVRERLIREGQVKGPALETVRLMSRGYTRAQKSLADNYTAGSVVAFL